MSDKARKTSVSIKAASADTATPMMVQYLAIKEQHDDCLLFYRMGDFYELFFDDAVKAAAALDITLTKRGRHLGDDIPMCGVPVHSAEGYLNRLIRAGFKVAVCEQTEDPAEAKKRGAKAVVAREVIRLVTPGTLTEDALLNARANNFLSALARADGQLALAWLDISTGEFEVQGVVPEDLSAELARLDPGELLLPEGLAELAWLGESGTEMDGRITTLAPGTMDSAAGLRRLKALFAVETLDAFGDFARADLAAAGALLAYVDETQKGKLPRIKALAKRAPGASMSIDPATRRSLELTRTLSGERKGSLLHDIDRTVTGGGARLLAAHLAAPLSDPEAIRRRLDFVAYFVDAGDQRGDLRKLLRRAPDVERALARLSLERGGPRDLAAVRDGLAAAGVALGLFADSGLHAQPAALRGALERLAGHSALVELLQRALAADLPMASRDGGFIAAGYNAALDDVRALRDESRRLIAALQQRYAREAEIETLKIKHNKVIGYHIEVPARRADKMMTAPLNESFIHRQTMANAVRFSTVELGELEREIGSAADRALALELELFQDLASEVGARADAVAGAARALAELDVAAAHAALAAERRFVRPEVDDSDAFEIVGGRHPVVEAALAARSEGTFVANDCDLGPDRRLWLVTGPNMAGKSTFLRQNALIAVLAQMGAFVPAERARIGVLDRLFSRVGAADDLARGRSTFMVEMVETSAILNQATSRSLVILDEIGRGTATFDGLSIAWAAVEHLHEVNRCRTLFATHYHEMTALAGKLDALANVTMRVKEWQGDVVFLHEVVPGAADRSYGIQVAKLAGLPDAVVARAAEVLKALEQSESGGGQAVQRLAEDLPLFDAVRPSSSGAAARGGPSPAEAALDALHPDQLSPREALDALYKLKSLRDGEQE